MKRLIVLLLVAFVCIFSIGPVKAMNEIQIQSNPWHYYYVEIILPYGTKTTDVVQQTRYYEHRLETLSVYPQWINVRSETQRGNVLCDYYKVYANSTIPMKTTGLPGEWACLRFKAGLQVVNSSNGFHSP